MDVLCSENSNDVNFVIICFSIEEKIKVKVWILIFMLEVSARTDFIVYFLYFATSSLWNFLKLHTLKGQQTGSNFFFFTFPNKLANSYSRPRRSHLPNITALRATPPLRFEKQSRTCFPRLTNPPDMRSLTKAWPWEMLQHHWARRLVLCPTKQHFGPVAMQFQPRSPHFNFSVLPFCRARDFERSGFVRTKAPEIKRCLTTLLRGKKCSLLAVCCPRCYAKCPSEERPARSLVACRWCAADVVSHCEVGGVTTTGYSFTEKGGKHSRENLKPAEVHVLTPVTSFIACIRKIMGAACSPTESAHISLH